MLGLTKEKRLLTWIVLLGLGGLLVLAYYQLVYQTNQDAYQRKMQVDVEKIRQFLRVHLEANREFLLLQSQLLAVGRLDEANFQETVSKHVSLHPSLVNVTWADSNFTIRWTAPYGPNKQVLGLKLSLAEPERVSQLAKKTQQPQYTRPFVVIQGKQAFEIYVPSFSGSLFLGSFGGIYSSQSFLTNAIPQEFLDQYWFRLVDGKGKIIAEQPEAAWPNSRLVERISLDPPGYGVSLLTSAGPLSPWGRNRLKINIRSKGAEQLKMFTDRLQNHLQSYLDNRLLVTQELSEIITGEKRIQVKNFDRFAERLTKKVEGIKAIQWATAEGVIAHSYPLLGNEKSIGHQLMAAPHIRPFLEKTVRTKKIVANNPYILLQGGLAVILRSAVFKERNDEVRAFLSVILDLDHMIEQIFPLADSNEFYQIRLLTPQKEAFWGRISAFTQPYEERTIRIADNYWTLQVTSGR